MADEHTAPAGINPSIASPARVYDYWLGGKDNFAADREMGERLRVALPEGPKSARANREFLKRAVRLAAESGVRQFIDIGSGLPTVENTHEVAQRVSPEGRVVYVDNDPIVLAHGRALLRGTGPTAVVHGDIRDPDAILSHPDTRDLIDFTEPCALLLLGILHFVSDEEDPYRIVTRLREVMAPGSYLIVSHLTADFAPERAAEFMEIIRRSPTGVTGDTRSRADVTRFFDGFDLLDPGIVPVDQWRPAGTETLERASLWVGVGRKEF